MKKGFTVFLFFMSLTVTAFGQSTSVTNNNSITIQGNVYYFQPSTTPSSPPPTQSYDFLGSGHWYGESAAKAWASIADWVIDHCSKTTNAIVGNRNQRVYISAVHVVRNTDQDFNDYKYPYTGFGNYKKYVRIDYWVVSTGSQMADGERESRWFGF